MVLEGAQLDGGGKIRFNGLVSASCERLGQYWGSGFIARFCIGLLQGQRSGPVRWDLSTQ